MNRTVTTLQQLAARGLLALAFLFGQHTAALHWLTHAVDATHAKAGGKVGAPHCDDCTAVAAFGGVVDTDAAPAFPASLATHAQAGRRGAAALPAAPRLAFRARAPPLLA